MDSSSFPDVVLRPGSARRCRVLFSYTPQNEDELELQVNDEIQFIGEVEEGWWRGKLRNKVGVFPSNFVSDMAGNADDLSLETSSPPSVDDAPILPPKPLKETCRVLFPYDAANEDELTLKKDDVVTIISKEVEDKGWWKGEVRGKMGLFPDNFVELIPQPEEVVAMQQKKPDRPTKTVDSKIPLISNQSHRKSQDNLNQKDSEDKKSEAPFNKKNAQNKHDNKNLDLFQIKADTVASHRKSLELKATENQSPQLVGKKPVLPPPISNKPKPPQPVGVAGRVKKLNGELTDLVESSLSRSSSGPGLSQAKRLSGDMHDLIDGALSSKYAQKRLSVGGEEVDLDSVERSDMLTHITASRPKAPGRRPPSKDGKENDFNMVLTNGTSEPPVPILAERTPDVQEKKEKERQWEKHKPPWVEELKSNLKTTKTSPSKDEKRTPPSVQSVTTKPTAPNPLSPDMSAAQGGSNTSITNSTSSTSSLQSLSVTNKQNQVTQAHKSLQLDQTYSKISELSSRFSSVTSTTGGEVPRFERARTVDEMSKSFNSATATEDEVMNVSRSQFVDLKTKVERLEKMVMDMAGLLREESDRRRLMEKEISKLTDLVTQV